jgi:hypothetical protein
VDLASFRSRLDSLPSWIYLILIVATIIVVSALFQWPGTTNFPMDDSYIHVVYAQNLVEHGQLMFNSSSERGVGSTSLLWVLLLASGELLGLPIHVVAKVSGIGSLVIVGVGLFLLLRSTWGSMLALAAAFLITLSGNMLWFALSGMETMLFLALGMLALLVYKAERWFLLGIVLGMLILTRPDGLALAIAIGCIDVLRHKNINKGILVTAGICVVVCAPWFVYLKWRTGYFLPTSVISKTLAFTISKPWIMERNEFLGLVGRFPALTYIGTWMIYFLEFTLCGMAFPPPRIDLSIMTGIPGYTLSLWAVAGLVGVIIPLGIASSRRVPAFHKWSHWLQKDANRPMFVLLVWAIFQNAGYILFMPIPGTASRYGALNHIVLWLVLVNGFLYIGERGRLSFWLGIGILFITISNMVYWSGVYRANIQHMQKVRKTAAHFVNEHFSPDERCAAYDVGAVRYYSQRPIVDMAGLIDPIAGKRMLEGEGDEYLVENGVTCVVWPGRIDTVGQGWWFNLAEIMGIQSTSLFQMKEIAMFEIDYHQWLQGYLPTGNYQASVTVYRLEEPVTSNE